MKLRRPTCVLAGVLVAIVSFARVAAALALPEGAVNQFSVPTAGSMPSGIAPGPDGNMWFTEYHAQQVAQITTGGAIREIPLVIEGPLAPEGIAAGADGDVWFTGRRGNVIMRVAPNGVPVEFSVPGTDSEPEAIALGPDGNMWFTEYGADKIGRITPSGTITEFSLPTLESGPLGITRGADGNIWFTEEKKNQIGRVTPSGSVIEFPVPTAESEPWNITTGADGNLWFTEFKKNKIARLTPNGVFTEFTVPTAGSFPGSIAPGPDGNVWFAEFKAGKVGRVAPSGSITEFQLPSAESEPSGIAAGPDGNMWVTESKTNMIAQVGTGAPAALPTAPVVNGGAHAQTVQTCAASWSTWGPLQASVSLFAFDGYRWMFNETQVGTGATYTPTREQVGQPLYCEETVTYPLLNVTASASSAPVTVLAPPPPVVADVHQSAGIWREGHALAHVARRSAREHKAPPVGTVISFKLSENAMVTFRFAQRAPRGGRGACKAGRSRSAAKNCAGTKMVGSLSLKGRGGTDRVIFQGRISRTRTLAPGSYTLTITAVDGEGARSAPRSLRFRIVR